MIKNYFKIAWRNLWKGRLFNSMNILGLSVAIACCILLFLTVYYEFSYDQFHKNIADIYQVYFTANKATGVEKSTSMPEAILPALKNEYPDILYATRMSQNNTSVKYGEKELQQGISFVDADFLKIFSFPLIKGNALTALNSLNGAVITEYAAKAIFGNVNPIGKVIRLKYDDQPRNFTVNGLAKDFPPNSSIGFDILVGFENNTNYLQNLPNWDNHNCIVYTQLNKQADAGLLTNKLVKFTAKYFKQDISNLKRDGATKDAAGNVFSTNLSPFSENHFNSEIGGVGGGYISKSYVFSLLAIGVFILLIACINFVNLSVARGLTRAREVGVRKTLGAAKWQLLTQFWLETVLVCLVALVAGILIAYLALPFFKSNFRSTITLQMLLQPVQLLSAAAIFIAITFIAGFYPALLMVRYKTVLVLKGSVNAAKPGKVRNVLLVTQFTLSTLLIICTIITWQQISYLQTKPLGYNKSEVLSIPTGSAVNGLQALQLLRDKLNGQANIEGITGAYNNLGRGNDGSAYTSIIGFNYKGHEISSHEQRVDYDYLKTLDIKLISGRDFSTSFGTDTNAVVVNEKMATLIGAKNVIGTFLPLHDGRPPMQVIGVVQDYNFLSLHEAVKPLTLCMEKAFPINYIFIRVKPGNLVNTFDGLKKSWHQLFPNTEFKGSWLDENTQRQYKTEKRLANMFIGSAIIAIIISCIGLLAISIMVMIQRTKEIGIRKVLGANIATVVFLLSREFLRLVLLASVISFPVAWWVMHQWLQGLAYHTDIHWWVFIAAGLMAAIIAFATIGVQALKAAMTSPVKSLRSE